jgi:hypothetical protein
MSAQDGSLARVVGAELAGWRSPLEPALFGNRDPAEISRLIDRFCLASLGSPVVRGLFYRRSVGAVFGVRLDDGRGVVVKVHRPEIAAAGLPGAWLVQRHLAGRGLPCPLPLVRPAPLASGIATADELLDRGVIANAHLPRIRQALALGLREFILAARPLVDEVPLDTAWPFGLPRHRLWPTPHDLRFDFSAPGGEWIDEAAASARARLRYSAGDVVIGHSDWRVENLRMEGEVVVAIYDWDSVHLAPEPGLIGQIASFFTANWADAAVTPYPTLEESRAFVLDYEGARGVAFTAAERETVDAAHLYALAYSARCQHSDWIRGIFPDMGPGTGWLALLRERVHRPLLGSI